MFAKLFDFSYQRQGLQALGWYLCFFLITGLIAGFVSAFWGIFAGSESFSAGIKVGAKVAILLVAVLGVLLIKNRPKNAANIALVLAGIALSTLLGGLGGLIPLAMLTTRPPQYADPFRS